VSSQFLTPSLFNTGATPYADVGDQLIGDLSATLTLPDKHYSVTAYVRNFTDNRYKTDVLVQTVQPVNVSATLYDPRTVGVILSAHF
jgi:iron complex outermembrane receptor protein